MKNNKLLIRQLDKKLADYQPLIQVIAPHSGWINTIRTSLNMTYRQLGTKMGISAQGAKGIEEREKTGDIQINTLKEAAKALNMKFVYGFVPIDGSLEKMIELQAQAVAKQIVGRTSRTMKLEDQENTSERLATAVKELTADIIREMPKYLWE